MKKLFFALVLLASLSVPAFAQVQPTVYNPPAVQFEHDQNSWDMTVLYRMEWLIEGPEPRVSVATVDIPKSKVQVVVPPAPPIDGTFKIMYADIPMSVPFGKTYLVRLHACNDLLCSDWSEVARNPIRYTYCKATDTAVRPLTVVQTIPPLSVNRNTYLLVDLTITSVKPVHAVSIQLVGSGLPAFYFTGYDLRGASSFAIGPLTRAGRFLMNLTVTDEWNCSATQATYYLTVR
jgi:hypothetical protein